MGVVVIRDKKTGRWPVFFPGGDDWPADAVSACRDHVQDPWRFTTKADILQKKRKRQARRLWEKRHYGEVQQRYMYVWVFFCPGLAGFAYRGWWVYIIGNGYDSGKYLERDKETMTRLIQLFPVSQPSLFAPNIEEWKMEFVNRYRRGKWCGRPQGKAPIVVEMQGGRVVSILRRAEWP